MEDYDEINNKLEILYEDAIVTKKVKTKRMSLLLKIILMLLTLYMIFFIIVSMVLIFGEYNGN